MLANTLTESSSVNGYAHFVPRLSRLIASLFNQLANARKTHDSRLFAVSEFWHGDVAKLIRDMRAFPGEMCFFDVPLHENFFRASEEGSKFDLRKILHGSLVKARPGDACTFVDNHDTRPEGSLSSWVRLVPQNQFINGSC